ncbi:NUDIX domain-containing protein [Flavobacterium psychrotrophum]|uniref:NUDIX domain-containing protein n=1 Tax=Flavobacterium psychrotrophum TaxID=2294119 RepID=UPI000E324449|nr:NUDIX domain-containing protein [Flavobacterium psychrotrophum]
MKVSAGILLYRLSGAEPEFLLVHPGGPFFTKKDAGWWTIPKGEPNTDEDLLACAQREFAEETGYSPQPPFALLAAVIQKAGKKVHCWAAEGNLDANAITCNTFEIEWPPRSGKAKSFPEVDKAGWFVYSEAVTLINERQVAFLDEALQLIKSM